MLAAAMLSQSGGSSEPLKPSGAWSIDYGDDACTLSRSLTADLGMLSLRREAITRDGGIMVLTMPDTKGSRNGQFKASFAIAGTESVDVRLEAVSLPDNGVRVVTAYLDALKLAKLTSSGTFAFPVSRDDHIWLQMGSFDDALAALRKCSDDLVSSLGVPAAELDMVAKPPEPVGSIDLAPRRFPSELRGQDWMARSRTLFEIDTEGSVAGCRVISYSGPEVLRGSTCERPFRLKFKPARSETGAAVRSWAVLVVTSTGCDGRPLRNGQMTC